MQGLWVFFTPLPMLVLHKLDPKGEMGGHEPGPGPWVTRSALLHVVVWTMGL